MTKANMPRCLVVLLSASLLISALLGYKSYIMYKSIASFSDGLVALELGDYPTAERAFRATVRTSPRWAPGYLHLGLSLIGRGRTEQALDSFRSAIQLQPDYARAYYHLAEALDKQGRSEEARSVWKLLATMRDASYAERARRRLLGKPD